MTETAKTVTFAGVALAVFVLALATRPNTSRNAPSFADDRQPFVEFSDPAKPKAMEVVEFDEALGSAKPFRVEFKNGRWTIPSHHNYPADAEQRLKKTAGAIIGLTKDSVVSDRKEDHAELGLVDPFEKGAGTKGWGNRVKLFDENNNVIADLIIGKEVPNRTGFRFVRVPGADRSYAVQTKDLELSIKFADWIDTNLLELSSVDLDKVTMKNYSVDLRQRKIIEGDTVIVDKDKEGNWKVEGISDKEETDKDKAGALASALADLKIVGVRQKPPGIKPDLTPEGQSLFQEMVDRGFYPMKSGLVSNDGETIVKTKDGLVYTLRFGGMILGTGDEVTAGAKNEKAVAEKKEEKKSDPKAAEKKADEKGDEKKDEKKDASLQENRFLLVSVAFDESTFPPIPDAPAENKTEEKNAAAAAGGQAGDKSDSKAADKKAEAKKDDKPAKPAEKADSKAAEKKDEAQLKAEAEKAVAAGGPDAAKGAGGQGGDKADLKDAEIKAKQGEREAKIKKGKDKAKELSDRYANWFYVIPNDSVKKIRLSRADLVKEKKDEKPVAGPPGVPGIPGIPGAAEPSIIPAPPSTSPAPATKDAPSVKKADAPKAEAKPTEAKPADSTSTPLKAEAKPAAPKAAEGKPSTSKPAPPKPDKPADAPKAEKKS